MDKRKLLTDNEKGQFDILKIEGHLNHSFGRLLKRSEYCFSSYFQNIENSRVLQKRGPQSKLSDKSTHLKFTKMKKKPSLNPQCKQKKLFWAKEKIF